MFYNIKIKSNKGEYSLESFDKDIIQREMDLYFASLYEASTEFRTNIKEIDVSKKNQEACADIQQLNYVRENIVNAQLPPQNSSEYPVNKTPENNTGSINPVASDSARINEQTYETQNIAVSSAIQQPQNFSVPMEFEKSPIQPQNIHPEPLNQNINVEALRYQGAPFDSQTVTDANDAMTVQNMQTPLQNQMFAQGAVLQNNQTPSFQQPQQFNLQNQQIVQPQAQFQAQTPNKLFEPQFQQPQPTMEPVQQFSSEIEFQQSVNSNQANIQQTNVQPVVDSAMHQQVQNANYTQNQNFAANTGELPVESANQQVNLQSDSNVNIVFNNPQSPASGIQVPLNHPDIREMNVIMPDIHLEGVQNIAPDLNNAMQQQDNNIGANNTTTTVGSQNIQSATEFTAPKTEEQNIVNNNTEQQESKSLLNSVLSSIDANNLNTDADLNPSLQASQIQNTEIKQQLNPAETSITNEFNQTIHQQFQTEAQVQQQAQFGYSQLAQEPQSQFTTQVQRAFEAQPSIESAIQPQYDTLAQQEPQSAFQAQPVQNMQQQTEPQVTVEPQLQSAIQTEIQSVAQPDIQAMPHTQQQPELQSVQQVQVSFEEQMQPQIQQNPAQIEPQPQTVLQQQIQPEQNNNYREAIPNNDFKSDNLNKDIINKPIEQKPVDHFDAQNQEVQNSQPLPSASEVQQNLPPVQQPAQVPPFQNEQKQINQPTQTATPANGSGFDDFMTQSVLDEIKGQVAMLDLSNEEIDGNLLGVFEDDAPVIEFSSERIASVKKEHETAAPVDEFGSKYENQYNIQNGSSEQQINLQPDESALSVDIEQDNIIDLNSPAISGQQPEAAVESQNIAPVFEAQTQPQTNIQEQAQPQVQAPDNNLNGQFQNIQPQQPIQSNVEMQNQIPNTMPQNPAPVTETAQEPVAQSAPPTVDFKLYYMGFDVDMLVDKFLICAYYIKNILHQESFTLKFINSKLFIATGEIANANIVDELVAARYITQLQSDNVNIRQYTISSEGEEYFKNNIQA